MKEFNTSDRLKKKIVVNCGNCGKQFMSSNEPQQIKQGMLQLEDVCPDCGEYISLSL